ncbi:hypothetical protein CLF_108995 [Clonorchis sinensis]|uniref:C2H2-type domain-containing protein n=1 Tax=Clonorchis sinensis TaxID=79923 RepID=G7YS58_CLOSI|nr:hypothetical protein CLF_108995 [Clonorchis sinensis]
MHSLPQSMLVDEIINVCADLFVVIKRDKVNKYFQYLNSLDPHIKFSMELESTSGTLPFLDCMTHKSGGKLKTTIYRKSTDSGAVLNYSSAHPKAVYASIVSTMFRRVRALCTEEVDRRAAQLEVKKRLEDSGYPVGLIKRQLRRVLVPTPRPNKEWIGTAVIPYKTGTSEVIRRVLNTANLRVAFQKRKTLRSVLVQLKDRLPVDRTRNCVYRIKCNDCTKVYIGQTARELHTRIGEHKRSINRPPKNIDEYQAIVNDSAMSGHVLDTGHRIDLENVDILRRGLRFTPQRLVAEAVEIAKHPSVNRIEGVELASSPLNLYAREAYRIPLTRLPFESQPDAISNVRCRQRGNVPQYSGERYVRSQLGSCKFTIVARSQRCEHRETKKGSEDAIIKDVVDPTNGACRVAAAIKASE